MIECSFLIPMRRDAEISDGKPHGRDSWLWLESTLYDRFDAFTAAPGEYRGVWKSPSTQSRIRDKCRKYEVAVLRGRLPELRGVLRAACDKFEQRCIYLSVAGHVELIEANP